MSDVTQESWKGHAIRIRTIPVRQILTRMSAPDGYIAIVRIDRNDEVLADWHLPRFSERWTSAAEAQPDAVECIGDIRGRGLLGAIEAQGALAT